MATAVFELERVTLNPELAVAPAEKSASLVSFVDNAPKEIVWLRTVAEATASSQVVETRTPLILYFAGLEPLHLNHKLFNEDLIVADVLSDVSAVGSETEAIVGLIKTDEVCVAKSYFNTNKLIAVKSENSVVPHFISALVELPRVVPNR